MVSGPRMVASRNAGTTQTELFQATAAMRPQLVARAFELCRNEADAEDLVAGAFEALVGRPPEPRGELQLRHWLRSVMLNLHRRQRQSLERGLGDPLDYEPLNL